MGEQINTAFKRINVPSMGVISKHKKYDSLLEAIEAKDEKAIKEFEKEASTGGVIQLTGSRRG
jgi:hypothetical protein